MIHARSGGAFRSLAPGLIQFESRKLADTPFKPCDLRQPQPPQRPHLHALPTINLGPNIQVEIHLALRILAIAPPRIEINHILHLFPTTIHHPVMAIERRRVSQESIYPRLGRQPVLDARKTVQHGPHAALPGVGGLPPLDLGPGLLVDGVVDGHDRLHVGGLRGVEALAPHGVEEHLLRGVDPVAGGLVGARLGLVVERWRVRRGGLRWYGTGGWAGVHGSRDGGDFAFRV